MLNLDKFISEHVIKNLVIRCYLTKPNKFYDNYKVMETEMLNDYQRVYLINIAPTNEKTENDSPVFMKNILKYNEIIKAIVSEINSPKLFLIHLYSIISTSVKPLNKLVFEHDGYHITPLSHKIMVDKIIQYETKFVKIKHN